ncbi:MAG: hypothetical protein ACTHKU_10320, partial [Verrucomicrobiota bacterium]
MGIKWNCSNPACHQPIEVEARLAGSTITCPACGSSVRVPSGPPIVVEAVPVEATPAAAAEPETLAVRIVAGSWRLLK